jgi:hypothetical protein
MVRHTGLRRFVAGLALIALLAPGIVLAQAEQPSDSATPAAPGSAVGAFMAAGCGASIRIARAYPEPIVVTVTFFMCAFVFVDALTTHD